MPRANRRTTRLSTTTKTSTSTESRHVADSNPCFDDISEDSPESRRRAGAVGRLLDDSNARSGRLDSSRRNHVVDPQAEPNLLEAGKDDCQTPRRLLDQACSSSIKQARRYREQGRAAKRWEDDLDIYFQPDRSNRDTNDLTSDMTWPTTADDSSKWDAVESDLKRSRLKQPARPLSPQRRPPN